MTDTTTAPRLDSMRLSDGRQLAYAEYGNPDGPPLMYCHGLPGSRLFRVPAWQDSAFRIIAPDRPGFGSSDFLKGRRLLDWPGDVTALADHLGIDEFHLGGVSGGGPHALVCGHGLPDRVPAITVQSGAGPIDSQRALDGMHGPNKVAFTLARKAPWMLRGLLGASAALTKFAPASLVDKQLDSMKQGDRDAIRNTPGMKEILIESGKDATSGGMAGVVRESAMLAEPWGFDIGTIAQPVHFWQGTQDENVPDWTAQAMADRMPNATVTMLDEGHLLLVPHWQAIETALLAAT